MKIVEVRGMPLGTVLFYAEFQGDPPVAQVKEVAIKLCPHDQKTRYPAEPLTYKTVIKWDSVNPKYCYLTRAEAESALLDLIDETVEELMRCRDRITEARERFSAKRAMEEASRISTAKGKL